MIDVYRSVSGRDAVIAWSEQRLASWPTGRTSHLIDVVPSSASLDAGGAVGRSADDAPVSTHVVVLPGPHAPADPLAVAPDVVLVPEAGFCAATYADAAAALASLGTVWVLDVPGQPGLSSPRRPRHGSGAWTAAWLDGLLDALPRRADGDPARVLLVGHAAGAVPVLGARSDAVAARLLLAPAGIIPLRVGPLLARDATRWHMRATPSTSAALARHLAARDPEPWLVEWLTVAGRACRGQGNPRPLPRYVVDPALARPARIVVGDVDCYLTGTALAAALSRRDDEEAEVDLLHGLGHLPDADGWARIAEQAALLVAATHPPAAAPVPHPVEG